MPCSSISYAAELAQARPIGEFPSYLSELLSLLFPLGAILSILLDCAEEKVDLGDDDFRERVGSRGTICTWAGAGTEGAMMRTVW